MPMHNKLFKYILVFTSRCAMFSFSFPLHNLVKREPKPKFLTSGCERSETASPYCKSPLGVISQ